MGETLEYDADAAAREAATYETQGARDRRRVVADLLDAAPGDRVLSVGCGPGFEPALLGEAVGDGGRVVGVDQSAAMLALARDRCRGQPHVSVTAGDAASLPLPDASVDAATAVQVYEYLADVEAAFADLHRVLRGGGRAVVCDADWDALVWRSPTPALTERVLDAFDDHCPRPRLGSRLPVLLRDAGFVVERVEPYTIVNTELDEDAFGSHLADAVADYVADHEDVSADAAREWREAVAAFDERGETFLSYTQYCCRVRKPA